EIVSPDAHNPGNPAASAILADKPLCASIRKLSLGDLTRSRNIVKRLIGGWGVAIWTYGLPSLCKPLWKLGFRPAIGSSMTNFSAHVTDLRRLRYHSITFLRCVSAKKPTPGTALGLIPGPQIHDSWALPQWGRVRFNTANRGGSSCRLRYHYARILMRRSCGVWPGEAKM